MQKTVTKRIGPAHAFFLGALLALIALSPAIFPYGGRYITRGDYLEQQIPFILETKRILQGGLNSYSFATLFGAPAVGSYAFYTLGSPFIWPLALLPDALIPYGISVMAILKHAVCALTSFLYFRKMVKSERLSLLGSVLYTFSSFTVVNTQFFHFTEVIAFFPLILLGMEIAMSERPRPGLLALMCGINTLVNYYFMLGSALLSAMYYVFRFFSSDWKRTRSFRRLFFTVYECGMGCALAGVLLLPALSFMLTITRTGASDQSLFTMRYSLGYLLERLRVLLMPIDSNVVHSFFGKSGSWCSTAAYLPVFGLTGVGAFLFTRRSKAGWLKALLITLAVFSALPILCGVFVLYTNVAYTRWWYVLVLMTTLATLFALRDRGFFTGDRPAVSRSLLFSFAVCTLVCCMLSIPFALPQSIVTRLSELGGLFKKSASFIADQQSLAYAGDIFRIMSFALALLGGAAMLFILLRRPRFGAALAAVSLTACVQYAAYIAVGDANILAGGSTQTNGVYTVEDIAVPTIGALSLEPQEEYKRIDYSPVLRNYGLLRNQSSLTCFISLRSSYIGRFIYLTSMGIDESTTIRPSVKDPALYALLSVSEYHQMGEEDVPEGFVYSREENGYSVYTNPNALPMGYLQTVITGEHSQRMNKETIPYTMLAAASLDHIALAELSPRIAQLDVHNIPDWQTSVSRLRENGCSSFVTRADGFTAQIDAKDTGLVVFSIPFDKGFSATVDGKDAKIYRCNMAFMGVLVEPGEHEIVFTYRTRYLKLGIAMSLIAAVCLAGYVVAVKKRPSLLTPPDRRAA